MKTKVICLDKSARACAACDPNKHDVSQCAGKPESGRCEMNNQIACFRCNDGSTPLYCLNCAEDINPAGWAMWHRIRSKMVHYYRSGMSYKEAIDKALIESIPTQNMNNPNLAPDVCPACLHQKRICKCRNIDPETASPEQLDAYLKSCGIDMTEPRRRFDALLQKAKKQRDDERLAQQTSRNHCGPGMSSNGFPT